MNLYAVFNGYAGYSDVFVLVIAENEERAKILAEAQYRKEVEKNRCYNEKYYAHLQIQLLHKDCTKEFVSEASE